MLVKCENIKCGKFSYCMYLTRDYGWLCDECMDKVRDGKSSEIQIACKENVN